MHTCAGMLKMRAQGPAWHVVEGVVPCNTAQQMLVPVQSALLPHAGPASLLVPLLLPLPLLELLELLELLLELVLPSSPASPLAGVAGVLLELHATAAIASKEPDRATQIIFLFIFSEPPQY